MLYKWVTEGSKLWYLSETLTFSQNTLRLNEPEEHYRRENVRYYDDACYKTCSDVTKGEARCLVNHQGPFDHYDV